MKFFQTKKLNSQHTVTALRFQKIILEFQDEKAFDLKWFLISTLKFKIQLDLFKFSH